MNCVLISHFLWTKMFIIGSPGMFEWHRSDDGCTAVRVVFLQTQDPNSSSSNPLRFSSVASNTPQIKDFSSLRAWPLQSENSKVVWCHIIWSSKNPSSISIQKCVVNFALSVCFHPLKMFCLRDCCQIDVGDTDTEKASKKQPSGL